MKLISLNLSDYALTYLNSHPIADRMENRSSHIDVAIIIGLAIAIPVSISILMLVMIAAAIFHFLKSSAHKNLILGDSDNQGKIIAIRYIIYHRDGRLGHSIVYVIHHKNRNNIISEQITL